MLFFGAFFFLVCVISRLRDGIHNAYRKEDALMSIFC